MKKVTKKIIAIFVILILLTNTLPVIPVSVAAGGTASFTVSSVNSTPGSTVTVNVDLTTLSSTGIVASDFIIEYDNTKLELLDDEWGNNSLAGTILKGTTEFNHMALEGKIKVSTLSGLNPAMWTTTTGRILALEFKIADTASGNIPVTLTVNELGENDTTDIVATVTNGGVFANVALQSINLDETSVELNVADTKQLAVTFNPSNTSDSKTVTWMSSNEAVATVSSSGLITAVAPGNVAITATSSVQGVATATCNVSVVAPLESITINGEFAKIAPEQEMQLTVTYNPSYTTTPKELEWESSDTSVATVDQSGKVTATTTPGTTVITATVKNTDPVIKDTYNIEVDEIPLTEIELNKTATTIIKGETEKLIVSFNPGNTTDTKDITWSSSDTSIATVNQEGVVTAVEGGLGTVTITATSAKGGITPATCVVTVRIPLTSITLNKTTETTIHRGENEQFSITYNPADTTDSTDIDWSTLDTNVATVDSTGKVTAVGIGKTEVVATSVVSGVSVSKCVINVDAPLETISIPSTHTLQAGNEYTIPLTYGPVDATDKGTVTWSSSDSDIVSVDASTGEITGVIAIFNSDRTATITATSSIVGVSPVSCVVTVEPISITGITLNKTTTSINKGDTDNLIVNYNPEISTWDQSVTWSSSDDSVVTVSQTGEITAVAGGTAIITATLDADTSKTASCIVNVRVPMTGINLDKTTSTINKNNTDTITVSFSPADTNDDKTIIWTSSDESIATVSGGVVTAVKPGTVTITAQVGNFIKTCTVIVKSPLVSVSLNDGNPLNILKNQQSTLTVEYNPSDATGIQSVSWESSDTTVATVINGTVKGIKEGTATITVTVEAENGTFTEDCVVNVTEIPLNDITINQTNFDLFYKDSKSLIVLYNPTNTTDERTVVWSSDDEDVVTVTSNGIVKGVGIGTAIITAEVNGKTAQVEITVIPKEGNIDDKDTSGLGVIVEGVGNTKLDNTYELIIDEIAINQDELNKINSTINFAINGNEMLDLFDINILKNGINVTSFPDGIKIRIPRANYKDYENIKVVYVAPDGSIEEMPTTVTDDYIEFTTTHLSEYAITGTKIKSIGVGPETGDMNLQRVVTFMVASGMVLLIQTRKRFTRKKNK